MNNDYLEMEDVTQRYDTSSRSKFLNRVYLNLLGAIIAFVGVEIFLFKTGTAVVIAQFMTQHLMIFFGLFIFTAWLATRYAHTAKSITSQYVGLGSYVVVEAVFFAPILLIANAQFPGAIENAASITLIGFAVLTTIVFVTGKDFSFLKSILTWGAACAFIAIIASLIFGAALGTWFSVAMIALAGGFILFDTSNILHHYPEDKAVAASLQLFASVALMFWYVLRLFMSRD